MSEQNHDADDRRAPAVPAAFPIVGIGASAGGLEAFSEFLNHLAPDLGMAYVLVQHLDPKHHSILASLLAGRTRMPVSEAGDGMRVEPNHVYVIPPNTNLAILGGVLHLMPPAEIRAPQLTVDYFLRSLAQDQGNRAIGVILSGAASDGVTGMKMIKTEGGITFAEDRDSARYSSMPDAAIATGYVDFVLPPAEIAHELARLAGRVAVALREAPDVPPTTNGTSTSSSSCCAGAPASTSRSTSTRRSTAASSAACSSTASTGSPTTSGCCRSARPRSTRSTTRS